MKKSFQIDNTKNEKTRKNKKRKDKGITLVLLAVTIIVMIILAMIGIKIARDGDIVNQTKVATQEYTEFKEDEQNEIRYFISELESEKSEGQVVLQEKKQKRWSNNKTEIDAKITIPLEGYELYMKINGSGQDWIKTDKIVIDASNYTGEDMTVSAGIARPGENIDPRNIVTIPVDTIDLGNPSNTAPETTKTTRKIVVACKQTDGKSGINQEKTEYAIRKKGEANWSEWQKDKEFDNLDHNTEYEVKTRVEDNAGNRQESEVTEVKTNELTIGTLTLKKTDENGETYEENTISNKNIWVGLTSGENGTTTYESKEGSAQTVEATTNNTTITANGITTLVVTTTDGKNTLTREYVIEIDKIVPEIELRENNSEGNEYTSGTWSNQDIYHKITIDTQREVEKYQITEDNGATWNDISSGLVETNVDYESTFPLTNEGKPEWLGEVTGNGTYYFDVDGTALTSDGAHGNKGIHNKTANSYIPIDLRTIDSDKQLKITVNYTISSESGYDYGYATITESTTAPAYNSTTGQFIKVAGATTTSEKSTTINGGKQYYLHLGYRKDGSQNGNNDCFKINSVKLEAENLGGYSFEDYNKTGNIVTYKLIEEMEKNFKLRAVYTNGRISQESDEFTIKIDKKKPTITGTSSLTSATTTNIQLQMSDNKSGIKGYYISEQSTIPTQNSNWTETNQSNVTINNLGTNIHYYIWSIDNANNISNMLEITTSKANYAVHTGDNTVYVETLAIANSSASNGSTIELIDDYADESTVSITKNITLDVSQYILTRTKTITVSSGYTVTITGEESGKITSGTSNVNTITNSGTLNINGNMIIECGSTSTSYYAIYNNSSKVLNIENGTIKGYYRALYNYGTTTINDGEIIAEGGNSTYGIYNSNTLTINGGEVNSNSSTSTAYGIYRWNSNYK